MRIRRVAGIAFLGVACGLLLVSGAGFTPTTLPGAPIAWFITTLGAGTLGAVLMATSA